MKLRGYIGFSADWKWHFIYQVRSVDAYQLQLVIPHQNKTVKIGERLNLCLPFNKNSEFFDQCEIIAINSPNSFTGRLCHRTPLRYTLHFDSQMQTKQEANKLVQILLKDALLTKKAIKIYFEHLIPFFSKLSLLGGSQHSKIESDLADTIYNELTRKIEALKTLVGLSLQEINEGHIAQHLECILTEIEEADLRNVFSTLSVPQYIRSIRLSEHKLAINHNTLITLKFLTQYT